MTKKKVYASAFAVTFLALGASFVTGTFIHHQLAADSPRSHMAWKDVYGSARSMTADVDVVVVGRMVGTSPGRVAHSDDPQDIVPFELSHFVAERVLKGPIANGSSVTVERVGGTIAGDTIVMDGDGGPYKRDSRYVLFLKKQPGTGFYYLVNDEGRFDVRDGERLTRIASDGNASAELDGLTLDQAARFVGDVTRAPRVR